jgi:DNA-binding PucR family transcriptional regulator
LGALAEPDESTERLRDTLRVHLKHGCDATTTGELLRLHPNTVRYRIRQAEKKIGRPFVQRRVQIELALELVTVLGAAP